MLGCPQLLAAWLSAFALTGHFDALALAAHADSFGVPRDLMYAVAFVETRHSTRNTEVSSAGALGRMQIMPTFWGKTCGPLYGKRHYHNNVHCGALVLYVNFVETGHWLDAAARYNGTGPDALAYRRQIAAEIGRLQWRKLARCAPSS